jgi:glycosyltransferase involved in cell wall biosynthesis
MRILLIVPLPPPVTGHSLASQTLVDGLAGRHDTEVVNLSVGSLNDGRVTARRIREVGKVLLSVWRRKDRGDAIYLTISESRAGNLKDLLIYVLCIGRLNRVFIHLHGGTIGRELFARHPGWRRVNAWFINRLAGVIISGPSHSEIFSGMIDRGRIHVVPNSADDDLFVPEADVLRKFADPEPLRVLYLSSMTPDKGYLDLADAWFALAPDVRRRLQLDFAGRFDAAADRTAFERRIAGVEGVRYHGLVDPEQKRRLFAQAHLFCLPTRMFEGQPISILEAYASGCAVLTTGQRGIRDVFTDGVNGFEVRAGSAPAIAAGLNRAVGDIDRLRRMAVENRRAAGQRYRSSTFTTELTRILEGGRPAIQPGATTVVNWHRPEGRS